ncbi:DUF1145 domain-containing protein [Shewanella alkalitolerans]|uniref:DUF1145 domain-containing protein n=1 Tax=Shewanella alkalitolerans TaxID=2864209 RepID=UPI001C657077|nr:DUF1145 domain-containing protein [Shewanella alkalitolerans]QYJ97465.1 DUF1145 domain-containing protein [Shewanella alkalitolerans]
MKMVILIGKGITLFAWAVMLYNLFVPAEGNIGMLLTLLLGITLVMHGLQTLIFRTLFKPLMTIGYGDYLSVMLFGVFSLLEYRQRVMQQGVTDNQA